MGKRSPVQSLRLIFVSPLIFCCFHFPDCLCFLEHLSSSFLPDLSATPLFGPNSTNPSLVGRCDLGNFIAGALAFLDLQRPSGAQGGTGLNGGSGGSDLPTSFPGFLGGHDFSSALNEPRELSLSRCCGAWVGPTTPLQALPQNPDNGMVPPLPFPSVEPPHGVHGVSGCFSFAFLTPPI